jgi:hypothetical protein
MDKKISAHDVIAFCVVELGCKLPYEVIQELTLTDPLYKSLLEAWKNKESRADARNALLCCIIANCMGGGKKKFEPKDFMPKTPKTIKENETEIKANFLKYMSTKQQNR